MYRYRALFRTGLDAKDAHDVRKAVAFSVPLVNHLFKGQIEATLLVNQLVTSHEEGLNRVN
jgi:hypothetical protein